MRHSLGLSLLSWGMGLLLLVGMPACRPAPPTAPAEPLVPTPPAALRHPAPTPVPAPQLPSAVPAEERQRFGVGMPIGPISDYAVEQLGIGWYLDWNVRREPPRPAGIAFWQMARLSEKGYRPDASTILAAVRANPGSVWLIGNEPDVIWQDNVTPERYAGLYHELYQLIKSADPSAQVAIAGVSQPTPLRLRYLERVLAAYEGRFGAPMPVDIWNIHNFVLREERDSWGVSIPPGFEEDAGILYEIDDHDRLDIFREQLIAFRRWMAERGQRDRPLVVSEYGVLMPAEYGFESARVQAFMYDTFDLFLTLTDAELGYSADGNRLVQWWCWYSLADTMYPTGNLFDPVSRAPTALGLAWARYRPPASSD